MRRTQQGFELATKTTRLADPGIFLLLVACVLAVPLVRRRWALAAAVAALVLGANVTTQVLQELTYGHRHVLLMPRAYWPSGHTTAMVSLVLGLLLGAASRARDGRPRRSPWRDACDGLGGDRARHPSPERCGGRRVRVRDVGSARARRRCSGASDRVRAAGA